MNQDDPPSDDNDDNVTDDEEDGQCPECGYFGTLGNYCTNCEDSGMIYDDIDPETGPIPVQEDVEVEEEEEDEVGQCAGCGNYGPLGQKCDDCEGSWIYE